MSVAVFWGGGSGGGGGHGRVCVVGCRGLSEGMPKWLPQKFKSKGWLGRDRGEDPKWPLHPLLTQPEKSRVYRVGLGLRVWGFGIGDSG